MASPGPGPMLRACHALYGLAVGDALGMPTQLLGRREIRRHYGDVIDGFRPGPADHPVAAGLAAGTVTDDTEQAVLVGRLLVEGCGSVAPERMAAALTAWQADMAARGSTDLLGPSTRRSLAALASGIPADEAGREGATNGAAMRIAPVGIATARVTGPDPWRALVRRVVDVSRVTHHTGLALAGAAAVAAAVSTGIDGSSLPEAFAAATAAAGSAASSGAWVAGADVAARIDWAVGLTAGRTVPEAMDVISSLVGTSLATQESVPAAFAVLSAVPDDPWTAVRVAASLGGDTDTIAAMVGAISGACSAIDPWPADARLVIARQRLGLEELASALLALRAESQEAG